jgi:hypothetical protein
LSNDYLKRYTDEDLSAELDIWVWKRDEATAWGASLAAALEYIQELQREMRLREVSRAKLEDSAS